ncbi:MAG: hypothetical protein JWN08_1283 [Frankiales bacterium]|nr:hypothetical protein [Frankiales bacterium]
MNVVRRGSAVLAVTGVVLLGPVGPVSASTQELPPDDPSISEQQVDEQATPTVVLDDAGAGGCEQDPVICQSGVAPTSVGGGAQLPRTGAGDRLLVTGAVGAALLLAGAGAVTAGRRRTA